jgi:uncharacterized Zn finger protein
MTIPNLSDAALLSHATPQVFERGQEYATSGAVTQIVQRGNRLSATVEGSEYEPYRVELTTEAGTVVSATCSCPYDFGGWCKHIVAVLLACRAAPEQVEQRPPLDELLRPLSRDQLHSLLLALAERMPAIIEPLEHELLRMQTSAEATQTAPPVPPRRRTPVDTSSYRRQAERLFGAIEHMSSGMDLYYYTSTAADGMHDLIEQAATFTRNGDGDNALRILDVITEPCMRDWFDLDDSDGHAMFLFEELGMAWAEALLTADLSPDEREAWQGKLEEWQSHAAEYGIDTELEPAIIAARQGWDDADPVSDDYITRQVFKARLNVLERQGTTEKSLTLAREAGELARYAAMLVRVGRVPEAVETGLNDLTSAADVYTLATTLHQHGEIDAALQVAEHGLSMAGTGDRLAGWLRDVAQQQGQHDLALRAAEAAFRSSPTLQTYHAVQDLAGEQWEQIRSALLDHLRKKRGGWPDPHVDIFLYEGLIDDAIAVVESGYSYGILDKVLAAAVEQRPDWVIQAGTKHAEQIINEGKAKYYDIAVRRLALVRRAYQHAGRAEEWRQYEAQLRDTHGRKRKLMDMLRQIGK